MTASTFALTRVPALMGRTLLEADERGDAEEVVVVGYDFWKNKLDGAADAVGRVIRISGTPVTIVGVMPRGYGFPQRNGVWRPLHLERIPEASPSLRYVFGRLAPGHPREEATAQVAAIGARAATMFPETRKNVRLQVLSLPDAVSDLPAAAALVLASINVFLVLLAALCAATSQCCCSPAPSVESGSSWFAPHSAPAVGASSCNSLPRRSCSAPSARWLVSWLRASCSRGPGR